MAVLPDAESAAAAAAALRSVGIPDRDITILRGPEGADRLDGTGAANGVIARLRRLASFTLMDQLVDMATYERTVQALLDQKIIENQPSGAYTTVVTDALK